MSETGNRNPEGVAEVRTSTGVELGFTNVNRSEPNLFRNPFRVGTLFVLITQGSALARATLG